MFYLLENNRIIDSENYKEPYILSKDVIRNREVLFLTSFKDQVSVKGAIKKQSENVFDLIEVGDLILIDRAKIYPYFYTESIIEVSQIFWSDSHNSLCVYPRGNGYYCPIIEFGVQKGIIAIYKPNSNGDYIKVWEKKDE